MFVLNFFEKSRSSLLTLRRNESIFFRKCAATLTAHSPDVRKVTRRHSLTLQNKDVGKFKREEEFCVLNKNEDFIIIKGGLI